MNSRWAPPTKEEKCIVPECLYRGRMHKGRRDLVCEKCLKSRVLEDDWTLASGRPRKHKRGYDQNGYRLVVVAIDTSGKKNRKIFRAEHIVFMEAFLGRPLEKHETVHHKNGVRDDNNMSNLELWSTHQPKGQRVEDKVEWAKEILRLYDKGALNE